MKRKNNIKKLAASRNLTAREIAESIGVSLQAVKSWYCNRRQPEFRNARKLIRLFKSQIYGK